jgi:hypothetical protein
MNTKTKRTPVQTTKFTSPSGQEVTLISDPEFAKNVEPGRTRSFVEVPVAECQSQICISGGPCPELEHPTRFCKECMLDFAAFDMAKKTVVA